MAKRTHFCSLCRKAKDMHLRQLIHGSSLYMISNNKYIRLGVSPNWVSTENSDSTFQKKTLIIEWNKIWSTMSAYEKIYWAYLPPMKPQDWAPPKISLVYPCWLTLDMILDQRITADAQSLPTCCFAETIAQTPTLTLTCARAWLYSTNQVCSTHTGRSHSPISVVSALVVLCHCDEVTALFPTPVNHKHFWTEWQSSVVNGDTSLRKIQPLDYTSSITGSVTFLVAFQTCYLCPVCLTEVLTQMCDCK